MVKSNSIYYRFRDGRTLSTVRKLPFEINQKDWSKTKQLTKPKELGFVNIKLANFKIFLMAEYNKTITKDLNINLDWVKQKQHLFFNTSEVKEKYRIYLKDYIDYYIETEKPKNSNLKILKNHLKPSLRIIDVNIKWLEKYYKEKLKTYAESTTGKQIQLIKQLLKHAEYNNIKIDRSALDCKVKKYTTINTYLDENELDVIFKYKFHTEYLNNAKRLFLVGSTSGMRVSDLMRIKEFKIENDFIEMVTKKTNQPITIPLDPRVREYIQMLRPISHQKFNKYLKIICEKVGFNEPTKGYIRDKNNRRVLGHYPKYKLISSHTMRRSFATNLYGKLPTIIIMAITGHTTEKSFLTYIKKPQRDFAEQLKKYYEKTYRNGLPAD